MSLDRQKASQQKQIKTIGSEHFSHNRKDRTQPSLLQNRARLADDYKEKIANKHHIQLAQEGKPKHASN